MEDGYGLIEAVDRVQCVDALATDQEGAEGHLEFVRLHQDLDVSLILKEVIWLDFDQILVDDLVRRNLEGKLVRSHVDSAVVLQSNSLAPVPLELVALEASSETISLLLSGRSSLTEFSRLELIRT